MNGGDKLLRNAFHHKNTRKQYASLCIYEQLNLNKPAEQPFFLKTDENSTSTHTHNILMFLLHCLPFHSENVNLIIIQRDMHLPHNCPDLTTVDKKDKKKWQYLVRAVLGDSKIEEKELKEKNHKIQRPVNRSRK